MVLSITRKHENMQDSAKCSQSEKMNNVDNPLSPDQLKILCKKCLHCISQLEVSGTYRHRVYFFGRSL